MPGYNPAEYVPSSLRCPHCRLVLRDAVQTAEGVRLCLTCYGELKGSANHQHQFDVNEYFKDRAADKEVSHLLICCDTAECSWIGQVAHLVDHLPECLYQQNCRDYDLLQPLQTQQFRWFQDYGHEPQVQPMENELMDEAADTLNLEYLWLTGTVTPVQDQGHHLDARDELVTVNTEPVDSMQVLPQNTDHDQLEAPIQEQQVDATFELAITTNRRPLLQLLPPTLQSQALRRPSSQRNSGVFPIQKQSHTAGDLAIFATHRSFNYNMQHQNIRQELQSARARQYLQQRQFRELEQQTFELSHHAMKQHERKHEGYERQTDVYTSELEFQLQASNSLASIHVSRRRKQRVTSLKQLPSTVYTGRIRYTNVHPYSWLQYPFLFSCKRSTTLSYGGCLMYPHPGLVD